VLKAAKVGGALALSRLDHCKHNSYIVSGYFCGVGGGKRDSLRPAPLSAARILSASAEFSVTGTRRSDNKKGIARG
jgi:hypothetical protein